MAAKSKPVDRLTAADLGIENPTPGEEVVSVQPAEERKAGEIVEDDGTAAQRIVDFLAAQKVI
jgi:electron transfer flavoprotein beta subunit